MSVASLHPQTAFQARSLVCPFGSICASTSCLHPQHIKLTRVFLVFLVPLPFALFWTVFQLQLPRICSPEDKGFVPRAPKHHRGTPGTGTDPGGTSKLALDEGQWYRMAVGGETRSMADMEHPFSPSRIESRRVSPYNNALQIIESNSGG